MALPDKALPYGLRRVYLTPLGVNGDTPGTAVRLPVARTFSFSETEEFEDLTGDDHVEASHGAGPTLEWELEGGGISLEAYATIAGGTVEQTGLTPNIVKTYKKKVTESRPYFKAEGQSINDNGGDTHGLVYRCKASGNIEGSFEYGSFFLTHASGKSYGSLESGHDDELYDFVQNETAVDIDAALDEIQHVAVDATGGTFTLTYAGQTTSALAFGASEAVVEAALEALSNIVPGDVFVTKTVSGAALNEWDVRFSGTLGGTNVAAMTGSGASLTGGAQTVTITTIQQGG